MFYAQRLRVDAALSLADAFGSRCQRSDNRQKSAASRVWERDVLLCEDSLPIENLIPLPIRLGPAYDNMMCAESDVNCPVPLY